ncbi:hypothetical protein P7J26_09390 [Streptococcus suis]|uniref:Uncharacterized protein n=1 Tax=Streptococcus suis TaxID=1307 RepID=A0A4T2H4D9_STRSU|nr:hypothetical protein [Streptococcus suis]TII06234.1 hypothetical protein FAJ34_09465 [Streptococcus suis]
MIYKRYHTALVFTLVLQNLLKNTELEEKALNLYGDILELEKVPKHQIKTAILYAKRIVKAFENGEIQPPSPFSRHQEVMQIVSKNIGKVINYFRR